MILQLASTSPRRQELLTRDKIPYQLVETQAREIMNGAFSPAVNAMSSGWLKARSAQLLGAEGLILGCDTIVVCCGEILEKPKDDADALRMLRMLSGNTHEVISGFGLIDTKAGHSYADTAVSKVSVREMSEKEIHVLLDTREHEGKSGSYMIQGTMRNFVTKIEGSTDSIIGLPVKEILESITRMGVV